MRIGTTAGPTGGAAARALRKPATDTGFALPNLEDPGATPAGDEVAEAASSQGVATIGSQCSPLSLADQVSDEAAAKHGQDTLLALSGLHLALLQGKNDVARTTLAGLAAALPTASDPRLEAVLRAIAQRAAIELARP